MNGIRFFLICITGLLNLAACSSSEDVPSESQQARIECSASKLEFAATGGEQTFTVKCDKEWTAFGQSGWVSCEVVGSTAKQGSVKVTVQPNAETDSRETAVVVKSGMERVEIPLTQAAPLQVSESRLFSSSKGETFTVEVKGAEGWQVTATAGWVKADKVGSNTLTITTSPNEEKQGRTAEVKLTFGAESLTITVGQESAEESEITAPEGYHLVWHDEFNEGTSLSSDWTHEVQGPGWVNNELQTYVKEQANGKRVTELVDGRLNIHCFKGDDGKIYSGRVYAKVNEGWLHGYFEARILLPSGKGTWPAFWMMPVNNNFSTNPWPGCGEIDIMEEVGADPDVVSSSIHCKAYNHTIGTQKTASRNIGTAESEYHVYACEWTEDYLRFYVDGKELMTFRNEGTGKDVWPFTYAFYPILNLAWGGSWGGYKGVDESVLPVTMKIDYVRVFQKK